MAVKRGYGAARVGKAIRRRAKAKKKAPAVHSRTRDARSGQSVDSCTLGPATSVLQFYARSYSGLS